MKKIIVILAIVTGILYSCVDPYATDSTLIKDLNTLPAASYLENADSLNVSMWVDLLKYTDLYNTMNLAADYTCFVPGNTAMLTYLAEKGVSKVTDLNIEDAKILVKYHTIKGALYSSVSFEEGVIPDTTATGDYLSTTFLENGGAVQLNLEASITKTIHTTNAYIHILNAVLTPVTETLWEKIQSGKFSIFSQAIEAIGYKERLNTISEIINNRQYKYHYTLFAVPDSVYRANGINDFAILVDSLKAAPDYTLATNKLNLYVTYHLLNQQISYASLAYFTQDDSKRSKNYNTMATSQLINISEVNKVLYINYNTVSNQGITLLELNRNCKNGVVHVIDGMMPVQSPKPTTVKWELTDYSVLASTLPKYRTAGLTSQYTYQLESEVATCYHWLSVPESKPGLYYVIANKNDAVPYKALNYDYLRLNLGTYGWVEMTSPVIVAGTYKLTLEHYNPLATELQGKLWFIIDGVYFGSQVATRGASNKTNQFLKTAIGTGSITFTTTTVHTVRILAADDYTSDLDCLTFTP
ncbi:MAG: fasciclin domain-containing protein [Paludibacter sp.]|nr:fasciclin domain-containing protein [Paludibacter sp.]